MIIPLDNKTRIRGTTECWQLESLRNDGAWRATQYFQTFGTALRQAAQRDIRLHPASSLSDAIEAVERIAARYNKLLDDALNDVESRKAA